MGLGGRQMWESMLWIIRVFSSWRLRPSVWQLIHRVLLVANWNIFDRASWRKYLHRTNISGIRSTVYIKFKPLSYALSPMIMILLYLTLKYAWNKTFPTSLADWILLPRYAVARSDPRLPSMQRHEFAAHVPWHSGLRPFSPVRWSKNGHCRKTPMERQKKKNKKKPTCVSTYHHARQIIIITLFQEDNIFGTNASLTYGPQFTKGDT